MSIDVPAGDRVRNLILRGDNVLRTRNPERFERALESFLEAREVASDPSVDGELRDLAERRAEEVRRRVSGR